ncbi:hypothetical protein HBA_0237 [Sodalis endosymbiont of Henestaris halophilus]|nr:hypothetical protein HBA_0237 [Sodalis endosymbiont of Henestaris halophilus]
MIFSNRLKLNYYGDGRNFIFKESRVVTSHIIRSLAYVKPLASHLHRCTYNFAPLN